MLPQRPARRRLAEADPMDIDALLGCMAELGAADLFLKVPVSPTYKISGLAQPTDLPCVKPEEMEDLAKRVLRPRDLERFNSINQVDFSYSIPGHGRYRGNCYRQRGTVAMVFRRISTSVPTAD